MSDLGCFNTSSIRVVTLEGNPWFVAKDIDGVLGFTMDNLKYHLRVNIGKDERQVVKLPGFTGNGGTVISESGLYKLIMRSDKPKAKPFQDWVTKEVLPSIRKTGSFVTGQPSLVENPQMSALELAEAQMHSMQAIFTAMKEQALKKLPHNPALLSIFEPNANPAPIQGKTSVGNQSLT